MISSAKSAEAPSFALRATEGPPSAFIHGLTAVVFCVGGEIFVNALVDVENTGIHVELKEGKATTGGYLGTAYFFAYGKKIPIEIQVSLRSGKNQKGTTAFIESVYIPGYSLVHMPKEGIVKGKIQALMNRHKPRDFYDYLFLLSGNYPTAKEKETLTKALKLLREVKIDFRREIKELLPAGHMMHLRDFKKILEQKILEFIG